MNAFDWFIRYFQIQMCKSDAWVSLDEFVKRWNGFYRHLFIPQTMLLGEKKNMKKLKCWPGLTIIQHEHEQQHFSLSSELSTWSTNSSGLCIQQDKYQIISLLRNFCGTLASFETGLIQPKSILKTHHVTPCDQQAVRNQLYFFITLTGWSWRYVIFLQRPSSPTPSWPDISQLSGQRGALLWFWSLCHWNLGVIFPSLDWLRSVTALSCCQASTVNERPPWSSWR